MKKKKLESKLSKEALEELKSVLEKHVESKLYDMIRPGFSADNNYDKERMYLERIKIMDRLVQLSTTYFKILKLLKKYEKNNS